MLEEEMKDHPLVRLAIFWLLVLVEVASALGSAVGLYAMGVLSYAWSVVFGAVALFAVFYVMYNIYKKWFN